MTPYILIVAGVVGVAALIWWPRIAPYLYYIRTAPTAPDEPDERDSPAEPTKHEGATEDYGDELNAAKSMLPSADLIRPAEQMVADHEALNPISNALDDFDRNVSNAISRFLRNQPTVLLRLPSSIEHTGELPVVELVGAA